MRTILLDIATAPLPNAADFIDLESVAAPANYKDQAKIDAYKAEKVAERLAAAALDLDLARITGIGWALGKTDSGIIGTFRDPDEEVAAVRAIAGILNVGEYRLVSYNGLAFDWPMLMRRARYLGVPFPVINCDRYKSPHCDLMALLTAHDASRRKSLGFYVKRLGLPLMKPLTGAEEAQVPVTGRWDELAESLSHDVGAIKAVGTWLGVL